MVFLYLDAPYKKHFRQKWVHVHYERAILHCRPRGNICIENNNEEKWRCSLPRKKMHSFLMKMSSFCLIKNELYVVFVTRWPL